MSRSTSLARRVAWGAALSASASALIAACATSLLMAYLLQSVEDRRLEEAAVTFAGELDRSPPTEEAIFAIHDHEAHEMEHTGILFAVYDAAGGLLRGERRLLVGARAGGCVTQSDGLRACSARSERGLTTLTGAVHTSFLPELIGAAVVSAILAALFALVASRPISRRVVAPLSRLRERIANVDVSAISSELASGGARNEASSPGARGAPLLGPNEHVLEVDALRDTIHQLVNEVERALALAHRFAANAAHELRTPLTSVLAELELLSERMGEEALRDDVQRARRSLAELSVLVERLLVLSVPRRQSTDAREVVSLRDLLEDAVALLPAADQGRVTVTEADALVTGDSVLFGTMITNALSNALKFGTQVATDVRVVGDTIILHVDDDGPGVHVADQERAFEPFFRGDAALRRRLPGHGLGLALVRHIALTHGGDAKFVTKPSGGARLEIRLAARLNE